MELSNYELVRYPSGQLVLMRSGTNAQGLPSSRSQGRRRRLHQRGRGPERAGPPRRQPRPCRRPASGPAAHCAVENAAGTIRQHPRIGLSSRSHALRQATSCILRPAPRRFEGTPCLPAAQQPRHPSLYLLGDHLDAALAMGEDLLTERVALADATQQLTMARLVRQNRELAEFLTTVRTLELSLTARLLQARKRAEEMKRRESRLKPLIALFVAGTAPLVDAAAELGDTTTPRLRHRRHGLRLPAQPRPDRPRCGGPGAALRSSRRRGLPGGRAHPPRHAARSRRHLPRHARPPVRSLRRAEVRPICPPRPRTPPPPRRHGRRKW